MKICKNIINKKYWQRKHLVTVMVTHADDRDKLKENFDKDKNRPNLMDKVTSKDLQDMIRVRTQLCLNTQEYKIFRDLFEKFKSNTTLHSRSD